MKSIDNHNLVKLTPADTLQIVELSALIGWDYTVADVTTVFESGHVFGHKSKEGKVLATAAIFPYGKDSTLFASLGMVIVHPEYRGLGLGKTATQACLDFFQGLPVTLVATEQGVPMYEKMGFKKVDSLHKLIAQTVRIPTELTPASYQYRSYETSDFPEVVKLDANAFGAVREAFLATRIVQSTKQVVLIDIHHHIIGFGLGIKLSDMLLVGPLVAPDPLAAEQLIQALVQGETGKVRIDIPCDKTNLVNRLMEYGFEIVNQPPVMVLNTAELPDRNGTLYGIAAQAFG